MSISTETLKEEREALKRSLRDIEAEQRKIEGQLKEVRQRELRSKREIEALSTLIDIAEARNKQREEEEQKKEEGDGSS